MSLKEEQDLLARMYTDRDLREQILGGKVGSDLARDLANAAADEVQWFAESLVSKRLREVEKLLPLTRREIGAKDFEKRFRVFADTFSPMSIKKHLEDALAFADHLLAETSLESSIRDVARFELKRLRHRAFDRMISLSLVRFDPREERINGLGIWIAIRGWSRISFAPAAANGFRLICGKIEVYGLDEDSPLSRAGSADCREADGRRGLRR